MVQAGLSQLLSSQACWAARASQAARYLAGQEQLKYVQEMPEPEMPELEMQVLQAQARYHPLRQCQLARQVLDGQVRLAVIGFAADYEAVYAEFQQVSASGRYVQA